MHTNNNSIPAVFSGATEYRDIPDALELAQRTFNEEAIYAEFSRLARAWYAEHRRRPKLLDLCAATGLATRRIAQNLPIESATLVDFDEKSLARGRMALREHCEVTTRLHDAASYYDRHRYDIILMNSAYHHIEDDRKVAFLQNAALLLRREGIILVGEHFLPPYRGRKAKKESVIAFYRHILAALRKRKEPRAAIGVIRRSGLYCWQGAYEFKVSLDHFLSDLRLVPLSVQFSLRLWPTRPNSTHYGTFVLQLGRTGTPPMNDG